MGHLPLTSERASPRKKRENSPLAPGPEPGRKPGAHPLSPALARVSARALTVDPAELRKFQPTEMDVYLAEAMLIGAISFKELAEKISEACGERIHPATVSKHMRNPLTCAWVCQQVHRSIGHRLGMIDAAMVRRAIGGDTRAADLIYKRYGKMASVNINIAAQVGPGIDYEQLTMEQLEKIARHEGKILDIKKAPE